MYSSFQSVRAFGKALKIDPWNRTAASNMADALCSQGKCEEAVEWFAPPLVFNPTTSSHLQAVHNFHSVSRRFSRSAPAVRPDYSWPRYVSLSEWMIFWRSKLTCACTTGVFEDGQIQRCYRKSPSFNRNGSKGLH